MSTLIKTNIQIILGKKFSMTDVKKKPFQPEKQSIGENKLQLELFFAPEVNCLKKNSICERENLEKYQKTDSQMQSLV